MACRCRGCLDRFRIAACTAPIRRLVPSFLNGYRELVAAVARYNRAATRGRAFSREIRAADHHSDRRICRFGDARNRKSDGLEFFSRVRRGAESGLGICSLVVLLGRRHRLGNSAHADKQARGSTAYLDRASFFAVPGHRHSRVGARHGIALPPGGSFGATEQWLICFAGAGTMLVIIGIAATSERHISPRNSWVWLAQVLIAVFVLSLGPLASRIIATALLLVLFFCFVGQTALLLVNQRTHRHMAEI